MYSDIDVFASEDESMDVDGDDKSQDGDELAAYKLDEYDEEEGNTGSFFDYYILYES